MLARKPKRKKKKRDFGHFLYSLPETPVTKQEFQQLIDKFNIKTFDKDLIDELMKRFQARGEKVNCVKMSEAFLERFPDTKPPEEKPPKRKKEKKKRGKSDKSRKGKGKEGEDKEGKDKEGKDKARKDKEGKDKERKDKKGKDKVGIGKQEKDKEGKGKKEKDKEEKGKKEKDKAGRDLKGKDKKGKGTAGKDMAGTEDKGKHRDKSHKNRKNKVTEIKTAENFVGTITDSEAPTVKTISDTTAGRRSGLESLNSAAATVATEDMSTDTEASPRTKRSLLDEKGEAEIKDKPDEDKKEEVNYVNDEEQSKERIQASQQALEQTGVEKLLVEEEIEKRGESEEKVISEEKVGRGYTEDQGIEYDQQPIPGESIDQLQRDKLQEAQPQEKDPIRDTSSIRHGISITPRVSIRLPGEESGNTSKIQFKEGSNRTSQNYQRTSQDLTKTSQNTQRKSGDSGEGERAHKTKEK